MSIKPKSPRSYDELFNEAMSNGRVQSVVPHARSPTVKGRYVHWQKLTYLTPPEGLSTEEWWLALKWARQTSAKYISANAYRFVITNPDPLQEMVHEFDRKTSGRVVISDEITNPHTRGRYIIGNLIEESISSSQIEGANTERRVAREMIRSGRRPRDKSEQMIFNNYLAMTYINENHKVPLTKEMILVLHRMLTDQTLDSQDDVGRFRANDDGIVVRDWGTGEVLHYPPDADGIDQRIELLCRFANGEYPQEVFVHPAVRAMLLHYWLAYEHPFVDGNGRTARALFYWSVLNSGYWLCEYISLSTIVHKAPAKYRNAFLYSETDENDVTYFLLYHLDALLKAIDALHEYLRRKLEDSRLTGILMRQSAMLNHRQTALLTHAIKNPGAAYTINAHARSHDVVYQTARSDLMSLRDMGLLYATKRGKSFVFTAPNDLENKLRKLAADAKPH